MNNERMVNRREVLKEQGDRLVTLGYASTFLAIFSGQSTDALHRIKRSASDMSSGNCQEEDPLRCIRKENRPTMGDAGLVLWIAGSIEIMREGSRMIKEAESPHFSDAPLEGEQAESLQVFSERVTENLPVTVKAKTVTFSTGTKDDTSWHYGVDLSAVSENHTHSQIRMAVAPLNPNWNPLTDVARRRDMLMHVLTADRLLQRFRDTEGVTVALEGPDGVISEKEMATFREEAASRSIEPFWVEEMEASH